MKEETKGYFRRPGKDVWRIVIILIAATGLLLLSKRPLPDEILAPLLAASAMVMYLAAFTHIIRRIMFPSISLKDFIDVVLKKQDAIAASVIFASMCYIIGILFQSFVAMLR